MFICIATKPLNDRTTGFRYNMLGRKGIVRKRKTLSRGFKVQTLKSMKVLHMGKVSVYFEQNKNKVSTRQLRHFAG